jgi:hypothetical protein
LDARGIQDTSLGGGGTTTSCSNTRSLHATNCCYSFTNDSNVLRSAQTEIPKFDVGTDWGQRVVDKVKTVSFESSDVVTEMEIYYATRSSLESYGIDMSSTKRLAVWPNAFKRNQTGFCTVPADYKQ